MQLFILYGMKTTKTDIFGYIDYRKFLQDYYEERKSADPGFTHTYICYRLGQEKAKSYFNNVIKGRTDVTSTFIDRFITLLELTNDESVYFRALVNYNQTNSAKEKEFFFDQLVRLNRTPHRIVNNSEYVYYKEWYYSTVRSLLDIIDFKDDYSQIVKRIQPRITLKQAKDAVKVLKSLGLIAENEQGILKVTDKVVSSGSFMHDAIIEQYQIKCLEQAMNVIASGNKQMHRNITMSMSMSDDCFERIAHKVDQFKSEIRSIIQKDTKKASRVYHMNVNFYPMSKEE